MSDYWGFEELGDTIQDIIDQAVDSRNFQKLNQTINQAVNQAVDQMLGGIGSVGQSGSSGKAGTDAYKRNRYTPPESFRRKEEAPKKQSKIALYAKMTGEKAKGIFLAAVGAVVAVANGIGLLTNGMLSSVAGADSGMNLTAVMLALLVGAGVGLTIYGAKKAGKTDRFNAYVRTLGDKTYVNFDQLSKVAHKPVAFVKKDVRSMIDSGWFLQGHIDDQETCLITSDETYKQYQETRDQMKIRQREEAEERAKPPVITPEVQEVLDKGNEYLAKIRRSNEAIPVEEISAKISRMEDIVEKIFVRAKEHPEIVGDLKKLMNYYLPMTIKLLDAYEDMDRQPVQGETIQNSKKEIEDTLDTLNLAFEKLLDSVFHDQALDVSSDISVLQTLLAQEGLTEDELQKMSHAVQQQS